MIELANGNLPNLQSLTMYGCSLITDAGVITLANGNLPNLQSLDIRDCSQITNALVIIKRFPMLNITW